MRNAKKFPRIYCAQKHKKASTLLYYAATDDVDNGFLYNARLLCLLSFKGKMARRRPNRKIEEMETSLTFFGCVNMRHILPFYVVA